MSEPDWALVHLKKCIEKTHSGKKMQEGSREGEVNIQGGIAHCPGGHRSWTVSLFEGKLELYCTGCKRCFRIYVNNRPCGEGPIYEFKNVSVGVK